jgi:hypothetical protein
MLFIGFIYLLLHNYINLIDKLLENAININNNKHLENKDTENNNIELNNNNIIECSLFNTIITTKNIVFIIALIKSNYNTFMAMNIYYFIILFISSVYGIRIYEYRKHNSKNYLLLTWLWHICVTIILCITSLSL